MSVSEALQETVADLQYVADSSDDLFTVQAIEDAIVTIEGALGLLGKAANVRPGSRRRPAPRSMVRSKPKKQAKKPMTAYQKAYAKAFKRVAPNFKKKDGGWKKGGFAAAGRAARRDPAVRKVKKK